MQEGARTDGKTSKLDFVTACCSFIQQGSSLRAEKMTALGLPFPSEPPRGLED